MRREGRCSGVEPSGLGAFIYLPGPGEMLGTRSLLAPVCASSVPRRSLCLAFSNSLCLLSFLYVAVSSVCGMLLPVKTTGPARGPLFMATVQKHREGSHSLRAWPWALTLSSWPGSFPFDVIFAAASPAFRGAWTLSFLAHGECLARGSFWPSGFSSV